MKLATLATAVFVVLLPAALTARAQEGAGGVISGSGTVVIKRQPSVMRMRLELTARGKDLKQALANLKSRREAAVKQLKALGAREDSVAASSPRIAGAGDERQRQMQMMIQSRRRGRKKAAETESARPPVSVGTTLTAEWPLKASGDEELLVVAHELQESVKAAQLAKTDAAEEELSPEEQELMEEMGNIEIYDDGSSPKPGEPVFLFVTKVTNEERAKATTEAFGKAKAEAEQLAAAAGARIGSLRSLSGSSGEGYSVGGFYGRYSPGQYQLLQEDATERMENPNEAVGSDPTQVMMPIAVTASFDLE